jgi:hypothetical protein
MNKLLSNKGAIAFTFCISILLAGCGPNYLKHGENNIKILVTDSLNLIDIDPRETETLHQIVDVLERSTADKNEESAKMAHIFHPIIIRLDNNEENPFEIKVESFSGNVDNTKVITKSINELFEEENLKKTLKSKKKFFSNFDSKKAIMTNLENFITKNKKDSIYIYDEDFEGTSIQIGLKKYKIFNNIDILRKQIGKALDENQKASFLVVLGTPKITINPEPVVKWTKTGNQKCINNVSHIEEKCETGEVRWINGGELKCKEPKLGFFSSKKPIIKKSNNNLPKALPIEGIKADAIKEGNTKDLIIKNKTNQ